MKGADTFTFFPELPIELRFQIWKYAIEPRIVEVHWDALRRYRFHSHPPPLLSVCKESRNFYLPIYLSGRELYRAIGASSDIPMCLDPNRDTLYFPYASQCSTSYGMSLEAFLWRLHSGFPLKHLALCVPLQEPRLEANLEALEHHSGFDPKEARGLNSTTFFENVQARARRVRNLDLKTLTIVVNDPMMKVNSDRGASDQESVTREFGHRHIENSPEGEGGLWRARVNHFTWILQQPHDEWYYANDPTNNLLSLMPQCTWGQSPEIYFRTVERNYARPSYHLRNEHLHY